MQLISWFMSLGYRLLEPRRTKHQIFLTIRGIRLLLIRRWTASFYVFLLMILNLESLFQVFIVTIERVLGTNSVRILIWAFAFLLILGQSVLNLSSVVIWISSSCNLHIFPCLSHRFGVGNCALASHVLFIRKHLLHFLHILCKTPPLLTFTHRLIVEI